MPTHKLTKAYIDDKIAAPDPDGAQVIHWDTELKGFGVLAWALRTKTFIVQRRMPDGRTRRVTVGAVGEFERVEDARSKAGGILAGLREGRDPKAERRKAAARDRSLRQWLDAYLIGNKRLAERSRDGYRKCVERHLAGWLDQPLRTSRARWSRHAIETSLRRSPSPAGWGAARTREEPPPTA